MPPFFTILLSFLVAKTVLLTIVLGTTFVRDLAFPFYHPPRWPFGYDSSSEVFLPQDLSNIGRVIVGLCRWDNVYFISLADRSEYIWEQEWAFGPGWPFVIQLAAPFLTPYYPASLEPKQVSILTSIVLSNAFHFLALFPLYSLTRRLIPLTPSLAAITCILHAFSPAGPFLLSGTTESLFNFLSFSGMALFHQGQRFVPALIWSLAGTVRSNAILWLGFFAWDALNTLIQLKERGTFRSAGRIIYLGVCALISLVGFAWWQYTAWQQYCTNETPEAWCSNTLPLIYSHVQRFLHYWSTSQLPNFLLASPHLILSLVILSNHLHTRHSYLSLLSNPLTPHVLALAGMSFLLFTSMHVQIATRVLTAFPALYWYLAGKIYEDITGVWVERTRFWEEGVRAMVVFGCVGTVLYSAFLPPA